MTDFEVHEPGTAARIARLEATVAHIERLLAEHREGAQMPTYAQLREAIDRPEANTKGANG